ncbi:glycine-rich protein DC9.1 isoform X1 [Prunus yedoensis var. nudiflora]|uniref:Glycine-rich protein DC9.1 isoform X1 n=1 Tax=Prunus yedoensis var. nudiflora TaxID=2094558 RepID=A0A314YWP7_PRUYE|nr:glycine-rich protein DC9.1 isoform X1 [Prunus yedoensis var. nudiflora]
MFHHLKILVEKEAQCHVTVTVQANCAMAKTASLNLESIVNVIQLADSAIRMEVMRGGEEDPIHKRHGHEHGGVAVEPIHGGKGHGHERGGEGNPKPGAHCKPGENNRACNRHGGHERGGEQDPIHKGHGHEHGGVVVEPIHGGKGHGHERVGEGDPRNKRPGLPGTTETKTKN